MDKTMIKIVNPRIQGRERGGVLGDRLGPPRISSDVFEDEASSSGGVAPAASGRQQSSQWLAKNRVITLGHSPGAIDAYRVLRTRALTAMQSQGHTLVGITGPKGGEGKSLTAINLAMTLAMDPQCSVLLVDCELRKPRLHEFLGVDSAPGLGDYLADSEAQSPRVMHSSVDRVELIPAGRPSLNSSELLASQRMRKLVQSIKTENPARVVVFDLPSLLTSADALALLPLMEAILLIVEENKSKTEDIRKAGELLSGSNLIGTVLNKSTS